MGPNWGDRASQPEGIAASRKVAMLCKKITGSALAAVAAAAFVGGCVELEEGADDVALGTTSEELVGVMQYGNCTTAEIAKLDSAVAILVDITGSQYASGPNYPAYEACLKSALFLENGAWSGAQIANQLRMNTVTGVWCVHLPSNIIAQAWEKQFNQEEVYFNKSFLASLPAREVAATIGHELMHNRGFRHEQFPFGTPAYRLTVPEQVAACIRNGVPNQP
jgi:hypothetical protein